MRARRIVLQGKSVIYLITSETIHEEIVGDIVGFDFFEDQELQEHPRLRRILTLLLRPKPLFYGVLHWSDGSDLLELDHKVLQGIVDDDDFAGAHAAVALQLHHRRHLGARERKRGIHDGIGDRRNRLCFSCCRPAAL